VDDALGLLAAELAAQYQIRGCDAVYVALAQQRGATMVTLDGQQWKRVPSDVIARTPVEALAELGG
jgi:predicted nucleic acid-binding protein